MGNKAAALTSQQVRACLYRAAVRVICGGPLPTPDDPEDHLLLVLEGKMLAARAMQEGLPRLAQLLDQSTNVSPLVLIQLQKMVDQVTAAVPALPPVAGKAKVKK